MPRVVKKSANLSQCESAFKTWVKISTIQTFNIENFSEQIYFDKFTWE